MKTNKSMPLKTRQKKTSSKESINNGCVGFIALSRENKVLAVESNPDRAYSVAVKNGCESPKILEFDYLETELA
jgi:hypothetical protein